MLPRTIVLVAALSLLGAGCHHDVFPAPFEASLTRVGPLGQGPSYTVSIGLTGIVTWTGRRFVEARGPQTAQLTAAELTALHDTFAKAHFLELKPHYWGADDLGQVTLSYYEGDQHRTGVMPQGGSGAPVPAQDLAGTVDAIVQTQKWIGATEEWGPDN